VYKIGRVLGQGSFGEVVLAERRSVHTRTVDVKLPGKGNSNSHGARPVRLIIKMIKWSRLAQRTLSLYKIGRVLGQGSFGEVVLAERRT